MAARNNKMFWIQAVSPVHVGTGQQVGFVDLPIAREKAADWPVLPGSGIKGVVANHFEASDLDARRKNPLLRAAFGAADDKGDKPDAGSNAGALVFTDARLLCMPVRSVFGTFAFATCHMALARLSRDLKDTGLVVPATIPKPAEANGAFVPGAPPSALVSNGKAYLADLDVACTTSPDAAKWASALSGWLFPGDTEWPAAFQSRFVILHDDSFQYFAQSGTEITTRVHIDPDTKTVKAGQLWTEEALPSESILAGQVWCDKLFHKVEGKDEMGVLNHFCSQPQSLQVGGKATIGRGRVRVVFSGGSR